MSQISEFFPLWGLGPPLLLSQKKIKFLYFRCDFDEIWNMTLSYVHLYDNEMWNGGHLPPPPDRNSQIVHLQSSFDEIWNITLLYVDQ